MLPELPAATYRKSWIEAFRSCIDLFTKGMWATTICVTAAYFLHIVTFYYILKWVPKLVVDMGFSPASAGGVLTWASVGGATGTGFAIGVGRGGSVSSPIIAGILLGGGMTLPVLSVVMAGGSLLACGALLFLKLGGGTAQSGGSKAKAAVPTYAGKPARA